MDMKPIEKIGKRLKINSGAVNAADVKYAMLGYIGAFVVFYLFYRSIALSCIGGFSFLLFRNSYYAHRERKRIKMLKAQFKDFLYSISASFDLGRQMPEAIREAIPMLENMHGKDSLLVKELAKNLALIYDVRLDEERVLRAFAEETRVDDIIHFFDLYFICRKTGANVQRVIEKSVNVLIEKMNMEKEIQTLTAQKRLEGKVTAIMPLVLLMILNLSSDSYLEPMYSTLSGRLIMSGSLIIMYIAYKRIERLTEINV